MHMRILKPGRVTMITEIGIVAGEIWHHLDEHGESAFSSMLKAIQRPKELILMSLGWLAREGHVLVQPVGADFRVALRKQGVRE